MIALSGQQLALYNQFKPALDRYHTGGTSNGGGVDGIQLPPEVSKKQLNKFIDQVSTFLATHPGIDEKEPPPGVPDAKFRKDLEAETAPTVLAHKDLYIQTAVSMIQSPIIAGMVKEALTKAPQEFFSAPSSSSGRYHPADEVNNGGLALHSLRDELVGALLVDFYNQDKSANTVGNQGIAGDKRDVILGALVLHDIEKGGEPWNKYDPAHGPLGATFLEETWKDNPNQAFAKEMEDLVNNHMAQWNKTEDGDRDPKVPADIPNQIVSYADYLGSQPNVFVQPFAGKDD